MNLDGSWLRNAVQRARSRLGGWLSGSDVLSEVLGQAFLARASLPHTSDAQRLSALLNTCRRTRLAVSRNALKRRLQPYLVGDATDLCRKEKVGWQRYLGDSGQLAQRALSTSLLLKAPKRDGEKGVLYCSFEYNWLRLVAHHDAAAILADYDLVGATSWSPPDYAAMAAFAGLSRDPVFIGVSNAADMEPMAMLRPVVEPLPILASDWIDPGLYTPKPHGARTIDILMVANWNQVKRHWLLFEALRDMPRNLRVVLVGRNAPGRTEKEILEEASAFGVRQHLELFTNLEIDEVAALQCDARISTIFTRREGSCVATAESLFAGAPVAMMEEAHIGSKAYINSRTGVLLPRRGLGRVLRRFWEESGRYTPREWALDNISCTRTSERLNSILKDWALRAGRPWTEDIAPLCWRYVPAYFNPRDEDRLAPAVQELERKHGLELQKFPGERASLRLQQASRAPAPEPVQQAGA
jgi:glycosyltransferase involved in cell wall biosynthesis